MKPPVAKSSTPPPDYSYLPGVLAEIAEAAGLDAALKIADQKGGGFVYFPARARDDHWLVMLVGREAANKLCAYFRSTMHGGIQVQVPLGPKNFYQRARRIFHERLKKGDSVLEISRELGVTMRTGFNWKAAAPPDDRQGDLF